MYENWIHYLIVSLFFEIKNVVDYPQKPPLVKYTTQKPRFSNKNIELKYQLLQQADSPEIQFHHPYKETMSAMAMARGNFYCYKFVLELRN